MPKDIKDHIIICNWNVKGKMIVNELHSSVAVPGTPIIVISQDLPCRDEEEELRGTYDSYENVEFRNADPNLHEVLEKANVAQSKSVIILADRKSPDPDAESVLTAIALNSIFKKHSKDSGFLKPYIVAEAIDSQKVEHLRDAGVDEVICPVDYGISLLSQCAIYPKLSEVYERLLTYSDDTNEIYVIKNPDISEFVNGKPFSEVVKFFTDHHTDDNPIIVIGVKRGESIILNPKDRNIILNNNDGIIVISYKNPDFKNIISKIK